MLSQEMIGQKRDVFAPLPQWRKSQLEDIYAVIEVAADSAGSQKLFRRSAGTCNDSNVSPALLRRAQWTICFFLEEAKQLGLYGMGQGVDFIEKKGAAFRHGDQTLLDGLRPGKSSMLMPEKLIFGQLRWDGAAVDGYQGPARSLAQTVNEPSANSFPRAGFS